MKRSAIDKQPGLALVSVKHPEGYAGDFKKKHFIPYTAKDLSRLLKDLGFKEDQDPKQQMNTGQPSESFNRALCPGCSLLNLNASKILHEDGEPLLERQLYRVLYRIWSY
jgi:hypothetical protein